MVCLSAYSVRLNRVHRFVRIAQWVTGGGKHAAPARLRRAVIKVPQLRCCCVCSLSDVCDVQRYQLLSTTAEKEDAKTMLDLFTACSSFSPAADLELVAVRYRVPGSSLTTRCNST